MAIDHSSTELRVTTLVKFIYFYHKCELRTTVFFNLKVDLRLRMRRYIIGLILLILASFLLFIGLKQPSNSRNWKKDFVILPDVRIDSNYVFIKNIRNNEHISGDSSILRYYDGTFNLNNLESLWFVLSPFVDQWRGPAHSFLSFGFSDSQFISISVEARKEIGESYSMIGGMFKKFELIYVVGDERDFFTKITFNLILFCSAITVGAIMNTAPIQIRLN